MLAMAEAGKFYYTATLFYGAFEVMLMAFRLPCFNDDNNTSALHP